MVLASRTRLQHQPGMPAHLARQCLAGFEQPVKAERAEHYDRLRASGEEKRITANEEEIISLATELTARIVDEKGEPDHACG